MQILSATEAVSAAIQRTREVLFGPFRWRQSWKLAAVAALACLAILYVPSIPNQAAFRNLPPDAPQAARVVMSIMQSFMTVFILGMDILAIILFYLGSRLQLVMFDVVCMRQTMVTPSWRKYRDRRWRWFGINLIPSCVFAIPLSIVTLLYSRRVTAFAHHIQPGTPPPMHFFGYVFAMVAAIMLLMFAGAVASSIVQDFLLPPVALENASLGLSCNRLGRAFSEEPGAFALYLLLKIVLGIVVAIAAYIALGLAIVAPGIFVALIGWVIHLAVHGLTGKLLLALYCVIAALAAMVYSLYVYVLILGIVRTFFQAYAVYFYGGRYQPLGDLLEPPPPVYVAAPVDDVPPMFPPPVA